jgi:hypothetical protein
VKRRDAIARGLQLALGMAHENAVFDLQRPAWPDPEHR